MQKVEKKIEEFLKMRDKNERHVEMGCNELMDIRQYAIEHNKNSADIWIDIIHYAYGYGFIKGYNRRKNEQYKKKK